MHKATFRFEGLFDLYSFGCYLTPHFVLPAQAKTSVFSSLLQLSPHLILETPSIHFLVNLPMEHSPLALKLSQSTN
jgi:hypothetical protein